MKNLKIYTLFLVASLFFACNDLNLDPLSEGSSENWYNNEVEINMSLNDLYKPAFWGNDNDDWTDDWTNREALTPITSATINGEWGTVQTLWANSYKAITRANTIIINLETKDIPISEEKLNLFKAEARFVRAYQYATLITHFGDVVFYTTPLDIDEAYTMSTTPKMEILQSIYEDYDFASTHLPVSYSSSQIKRATKGAALAFKARVALYMNDWKTAKDAALQCMELDAHSLHNNFSELFYSATRSSDEFIMTIPRSTALNYDQFIRNMLPRNRGGWAAHDPSWDLLCSFLCTDGLPIDESPLFNPRDPFANRDPRCGYTIVPFQSEHLGVMYQPHPDSTEVYNSMTNSYQTNQDTRGNQQFASFNGLLWKKGAEENWTDDFRGENSIILLRYADVLLMYAEAKIELNEIDESVLNAINQVRARAYGVDVADTENYPAVTATDQSRLRSILRFERRMEFANEGLRYMDLIRWKIAEVALNRPNYGMLDVAELREKVVNPGLWFFPTTPKVDGNGIPDFSEMADAGLIKQLTNRKFDASKQYLWPLPTKEILINDNLKQNPGY